MQKIRLNHVFFYLIIIFWSTNIHYMPLRFKGHAHMHVCNRRYIFSKRPIFLHIMYHVHIICIFNGKNYIIIKCLCVRCFFTLSFVMKYLILTKGPNSEVAERKMLEECGYNVRCVRCTFHAYITEDRNERITFVHFIIHTFWII